MQFKLLSRYPCAFVDLGSTQEFFSVESLNFLQGNNQDLSELQSNYAILKAVHGPNVNSILWPKIVKYFENHRTTLRLLEYLIAHDFLVLDEVLDIKQINRIPPELLDFFVRVDIPVEVREEAATEISKIPPEIRRKIGNTTSKLWYYPDKEMHDKLFNLRGVYSRYCFRDSDDSLERAYFYLSVVRRAGIALVVSPSKQDILNHFFREILRNFHEYLSKIATKEEFALAQETQLAFKPLIAPFPPVQEMIISKCLLDRLSPIDAFLKIRKTDEAEHYRNYIHNLFLNYNGPFANRLQVSKQLKEIETLMEKWRGDPYEGVRYQTYTIDLKRLPRIGFLAEMFDLPSHKLPKWMGLINPPEPEIIFMSRWFQSVEDQNQRKRF